jgi:integration host factor subunit beta
MNKSELISKLFEANSDLGRPSAAAIVNWFFGEIARALVRADRVELRGFGVFTVRRRNARTGRNIRTGGSVPVDEHYVPFFKMSKTIRDQLNPHISWERTAKETRKRCRS